MLAFGHVLADVPRGYVTIANSRDKGISRRNRLPRASDHAFAAEGLASSLARFRSRSLLTVVHDRVVNRTRRGGTQEQIPGFPAGGHHRGRHCNCCHHQQRTNALV